MMGLLDMLPGLASRSMKLEGAVELRGGDTCVPQLTGLVIIPVVHESAVGRQRRGTSVGVLDQYGGRTVQLYLQT
jgi:hypothetical protein